jgi:glutathione synthase
MKQITLAVLMDDIAGIKPIKDSSFAMMLEAQSRGWVIYTFDSNDMFHQNSSVYANARKTFVEDDENQWHCREVSEVIALANIDVIFMRKDPPFDMDYIYATYLLEQAENTGVLVVNKPSSLRDANEKLFALNFAEFMPKTLVSANIDQLYNFVEQTGVAVVKPLDGMGGTDIYKLVKDDDNIFEIISRLTNQGQRFIMAQEFLSEIKDGDKRILLINGKPVDYALARIPADGGFKGNLVAGATGRGQPLSERDRYLCTQIAPLLIEKELLFVGLDVIGGYITEINVTSPTCIRELDKQFNLNISALLLDEVEKKLALR